VIISEIINLKKMLIDNQAQAQETTIMRFKLFSIALLMVLALIGLFAYYRTPVTLADASTDSPTIKVGKRSGFVYYQDGENMVCRDASPQEVLGMVRRDPDLRLHQISPIR